MKFRQDKPETIAGQHSSQWCFGGFGPCGSYTWFACSFVPWLCSLCSYKPVKTFEVSDACRSKAKMPGLLALCKPYTRVKDAVRWRQLKSREVSWAIKGVQQPNQSSYYEKKKEGRLHLPGGCQLGETPGWFPKLPNPPVLSCLSAQRTIHHHIINTSFMFEPPQQNFRSVTSRHGGTELTFLRSAVRRVAFSWS